MTVLKDLAVVQETYTDRNGEEKRKWLTIGQIHASNEGREYIVLYPHINLAALPRKEGDSRLFVSMFEPKPRDGAQSAPPPASKPADAGGFGAMEEDVPFSPIGRKLGVML